MDNLPASNLPAASQNWGRGMEKRDLDLLAEITQLQNDAESLRQDIKTKDNHISTLDEYIRVMCQLSGYPYPPVYTPASPAPPPPTPVVPVKVPVTREFGTSWSATWYQGFKRTSAGGTNDDSRSLYQRGTGYTYSMWRFDIDGARGKQITSGAMRLSNISTYYNSAFTAFLGTHGLASEPSARPGGDRQNGFNVGWTAGESKWVSLPQGILDGLSNGSIQGFTMGDTGAERQNFARFNGHGREGSPVLSLTYAV